MSFLSPILLAWYGEFGRELPWRDTTDPYRIWISEIILQQTQVAQGLGYYERFLARFPDVHALASASDDEVMQQWQGLGYYSRARHAQAAARAIVAAGAFPRTYAELVRLPGIGAYTAAAICSFAYRQPYPVVDGNVYRVLARCFDIDTPMDQAEGKQLFATLAEQELDTLRPHIYNSAIMDFGALQCTPRNPHCDCCPMAANCLALAHGTVMQRPVRSRRPQVTHRYLHYLAPIMDDCTFIHRRTEADIWRNLYEWPMVETDEPATLEQLIQTGRLQPFLSEEECTHISVLCSDVHHQLTHRLLHANLYKVSLPTGSKAFSHFIKIPLADLYKYPTSRLQHQFFSLFLSSINPKIEQTCQ